MTQKAPGKSHRKGITMAQISKMFPDDETATAWVERIRWPDGATCPHCGGDRIAHPVKHKTMTHRCKDCRKWFSVRTGTCMESSRLGLQTWVVAIYLLNTGLKGQASMKLHRDLGVTQKTAWHLAHRIREAWEDNGGSVFGGPVEVDETHIGGKLENMHAAEREATRDRYNYGKSIVAGVKDRPTNKVGVAVVGDTTADTLQTFIEDRVVSGATVYTDDGASYRNMPFFDHDSVNHSAGEYVRSEVRTNGMEALWSLFKRGFHGTYHHMSPKHLPRYVNEFAGRHNCRNADTMAQMAATVAGLIGKRLKYRDLVA